MPRIHTDTHTHYLPLSTAPQLVFLPSGFFCSLAVSLFFLLASPLVWEKVIARAKKDDTGRITLSLFFRELLEGVMNAQTQPHKPQSPVFHCVQWQQLVLCVLCRLDELGGKSLTRDPEFPSTHLNTHGSECISVSNARCRFPRTEVSCGERRYFKTEYRDSFTIPSSPLITGSLPLS